MSNAIVKNLNFGSDAKDNVFAGITKLTQAVSSTLGASGKCVILEDNTGNPTDLINMGWTPKRDLDKYLDWLETPNENFGGRPVCPFLAPDRKNGKLKIEIYDAKVKTIWEHILIFDREDYNTALFLHIDDSIKYISLSNPAKSSII